MISPRNSHDSKLGVDQSTEWNEALVVEQGTTSTGPQHAIGHLRTRIEATMKIIFLHDSHDSKLCVDQVPSQTKRWLSSMVRR